MPFPAPKEVSMPDFSEDQLIRIDKYIKERVMFLDRKLDVFRTQKLPEMVRTYKGIPKNKDLSFPWEGASNLVVQLAGTFSDESLSRIMAIWMSDPLFSISIPGDTISKEGEDIKLVAEKFLDDMAIDPMEVNLYRTEQAMFGSACKFGTGIIGIPWEYQVEQEYAFIGGGLGENSQDIQYKFNDYVRRDGPMAKLVPLNKFGIDPREANLEEAGFFYAIETLNFWQLCDLPGKNKLYKQADIDRIKHFPDRDFPDMMQQEIEKSVGMEDMADVGSAEWDIYNCCLRYRINDKVFSIIAKYHKKSETVLWKVYNTYPKNIFPYEDAKLAYDDDFYFGVGYAQMLMMYQAELSKNMNWRANNRNMAMLGLLVVDPGSKLSSILNIYPGVMIPAKKDEVSLLKAGADVGYNDGPDQFVMALAKERAGVDPAIGGTGGGIVNNKRGIYSASGTSIVLAQQNNRNQLRLGDMRMSHMRIGDKLFNMYANYGIGRKINKYADQKEMLMKAFKMYKDETLGISVRSATSSNNKELDRQNDILLSQNLSRAWQEQAQMIAAMSQQGAPPDLIAFYQQTFLASRAIQKSILRSFGKININALLPQLPQGGNNGNQGGGGSNSLPPANQGAIPTGGLQTFGGVPQ